MNNFKLKLIISIMSAIVFSFIFILLTFTLPTTDNDYKVIKRPTGVLEQVSHSAANK